MGLAPLGRQLCRDRPVGLGEEAEGGAEASMRTAWDHEIDVSTLRADKRLIERLNA